MLDEGWFSSCDSVYLLREILGEMRIGKDIIKTLTKVSDLEPCASRMNSTYREDYERCI